MNRSSAEQAGAVKTSKIQLLPAEAIGADCWAFLGGAVGPVALASSGKVAINCVTDQTVLHSNSNKWLAPPCGSMCSQPMPEQNSYLSVPVRIERLKIEEDNLTRVLTACRACCCEQNPTEKVALRSNNQVTQKTWQYSNLAVRTVCGREDVWAEQWLRDLLAIFLESLIFIGPYRQRL